MDQFIAILLISNIFLAWWIVKCYLKIEDKTVTVYEKIGSYDIQVALQRSLEDDPCFVQSLVTTLNKYQLQRGDS